MIERGNILMSWGTGNFGFISVDYISRESLCINDLGLEKRDNESYYYNNASREYQGFLFQYTLDGYGIYESGSSLYKLTKGKAFFITFPEDSRYYFSPDDNENGSWTFFYIHFSGPASAPFYNRIRELAGPVLELDTDSQPISLFFELYDTLRSNKSSIRYLVSDWLYHFLIALLRHVEAPPHKQLSSPVAAAIQWMKKHYFEQLNLESMSREIGLSYSHLTRQLL